MIRVVFTPKNAVDKTPILYLERELLTHVEGSIFADNFLTVLGRVIPTYELTTSSLTVEKFYGTKDEGRAKAINYFSDVRSMEVSDSRLGAAFDARGTGSKDVTHSSENEGHKALPIGNGRAYL